MLTVVEKHQGVEDGLQAHIQCFQDFKMIVLWNHTGEKLHISVVSRSEH